MVDFGALPPEINSGLLYSGPGPASLYQAAQGWQNLATELTHAAESCRHTMNTLMDHGWSGPSSEAMIQALEPYLEWMHETARRLGTLSLEADQAAQAYHDARATIIPPAVIATNRAVLARLVATNLFGQNSAAIAAMEHAYTHMWAHDSLVMGQYANACARTTQVVLPTSPPPIATPGHSSALANLATQSHAGAGFAQTTSTHSSGPFAHLVTQISQAIQNANTHSDHGWNIFSPANNTTSHGLSGVINAIDGQSNTAFGTFFNDGLNNSIWSSGVMNPTGFINDFNAYDYLIVYGVDDMVHNMIASLGAEPDVEVLPLVMTMSDVAPLVDSSLLAASTQAPAVLASQISDLHAASSSVSATAGNAHLVRSLSVPSSWVPPSSSGTPLNIGAGPTVLPGAPMPGAVRGKSRYARRYGFRPVVASRSTAGG